MLSRQLPQKLPLRAFPVNANDETNINVPINNEAFCSVIPSTQQQTDISKTATKAADIEQCFHSPPHINAATINEGNEILPVSSHSGSTFNSSSKSTTSKSVESIVPCTYSLHKHSKNSGTTCSIYRDSSSSDPKSVTVSSSSPFQATNRCTSYATIFSKRYLSNQFAALSDHWDDDGDGENCVYEEDEDDFSQSVEHDADNHYTTTRHTVGT